MEVVTDSASLIFLARVPRLKDLLGLFCTRVWVPEPVMHEVVERAMTCKDPSTQENGRLVEVVLKGKLFQIAMVRELQGLPQRLGPGERATLALALDKGIERVLMDDLSATRVARQMGLEPLPVAALPIWAVRKGWRDVVEEKELLEELVVDHYQLSSGDFLRLMAVVEGVTGMF